MIITDMKRYHRIRQHLIIIGMKDKIIIMVIFKCYFSGELIALSYIKKKNNNNSGVNIELGKTNRLKALCMMEIKNEINKLCVNKQRQGMKIKSICRNQWQKRSIIQTNSIS